MPSPASRLMLSGRRRATPSGLSHDCLAERRKIAVEELAEELTAVSVEDDSQRCRGVRPCGLGDDVERADGQNRAVRGERQTPRRGDPDANCAEPARPDRHGNRVDVEEIAARCMASRPAPPA